eukprot:1135931-Prymnesium_polylepis.2
MGDATLGGPVAACPGGPEAFIELLSELRRSQVIWAAVHPHRRVTLGQLEARRALQVDVTLGLGQQPPAHEQHRAILEG